MRLLKTYVFTIGLATLLACEGRHSEKRETLEDDDHLETVEEAVEEDDGSEGMARAAADISSASGSSLTGKAVFTEDNGKVKLELTVQNAEQGQHAVHLHETGDCSAPDATSAGGHWNPTNKNHGKRGTGEFHKGDIGNMEVGEDGTGSMSMPVEGWSIGGPDSTNIVNKAVIIHAGADDFTSQPSGNAGARVGCGVINQESQ